MPFYFMRTGDYDLYMVLARTKMLMRVPQFGANRVRQQEINVAPVVMTSSINRMCLFSMASGC